MQTTATMEFKSVGTFSSDPSPPTPNKVEFGAKWVKMSAFLATTLLGEVGGRRDEPKAEQKIVLRSRVLRNNCLEGIFTQSQFFCPPL